MTDTTQNLAAASLTFSVMSFLMLLGVLVLFLFPDFTSTLKAGMAKAEGAGAGSSFKMLAAVLGAFSPDITLLSGFVSDILNGAFRFSATSLIGIGAVILHWIVAGLVHGFSGSAPTAVSSVAQAVASTVTAQTPAAAVADFNLGTGAEPAPKTTGFQPGRRVRAPGSVSTLSLGTPAMGPRPTRAAASAARDAISRAAAPARRVSFGESASQTGGAIVPDYIQAKFNPCSIRGLGMFDISKSPMGIAALSSVFAVYLLDMFVDEKRSKKDIGVYLLFSSVVYGLNLFAYKEFQCYGDTYGAVAKSTILPMVIGLASGAAGYSVLKTTFPAYLPLDAQNIGSPAQPGTYAQCQAPNDKDQFVCDAYKDGKRISTTKLDV